MSNEEWWREAVVYEVYTQSFADSNDDGIGDLPGVISRLDYIASLGVNTIWLSPFYPSPMADSGYDVSDFLAVDPAYGTLDDFDELTARAHERGIRVMIDLVMNHTSAEHPWFAESRSSRGSPRRDWYIWADPGADRGPSNNWLSAFEKCGPAWSYDEITGQCYLHSFTPGQPDLNWRNPQVRSAMRKVWLFWLDRGVDGFRVDVAHRLMKDERLRDNPAAIAGARRHTSHPSLRQRHLNLPETHEILRDLRQVMNSYGGKLALGEVPISDERVLAGYFGGDGMQTAFHAAFWEQPWRGRAFRETVARLTGAMREEALPTYALATHDIPRTVTRYGAGDRPRVAAMMMLTMRGIPCIYYGEEIGMADACPPADMVIDVDGRDGTRAPMRWDGVASQASAPDSLLTLYRRLISYRSGSEALRRGGYRPLDSADAAFVYERSVPGERLLIALNFARQTTPITLAEAMGATGYRELSTRPGHDCGPISLRPLLLAPDEGVIVRIGE